MDNRRRYTRDNQHVIRSARPIFFVLGIEGTGHHFWESLSTRLGQKLPNLPNDTLSYPEMKALDYASQKMPNDLDLAAREEARCRFSTAPVTAHLTSCQY